MLDQVLGEAYCMTRDGGRLLWEGNVVVGFSGFSLHDLIQYDTFVR